ncbi:hypothetical protein PCI56_10220 [Plesiomonas shigelloides subsp. oncorhynchi]|nr:hypothetical protein [Plesiomonas shigelloides]
MSRILLVEDDVPLGEGVAACLQQDGLEVSWVRRCADVAECWMRADLVVLDRHRPKAIVCSGCRIGCRSRRCR